MTTNATDKRTAHRRSTYSGGEIIAGAGKPKIGCIVRDLSTKGAKLEVRFRAENIDQLRHVPLRELPPLQLKQPANRCVVETQANLPRRISDDDRVGPHIVGHHRAGADYGPVADRDAPQQGRPATRPDIAPQNDRA